MILGILGVGHLASYTVEGLRLAGDTRRIILSPRNAKAAAKLAEHYDCEIAESNQAVIDSCDIVMLAVRPNQCDALLSGLRFKVGQLVISVMAGVSLQQLSAHKNLEQVQLVRSLPIQCAAVNVGPVPLYPGNSDAKALLGQLGTLLVLSSEEQFETAASFACMNGWLYFWLASMGDWAEQQGLDPQTASELTLATVGGAVAYSRSQLPDSTLAIGEAIATEGTYTLAGLQLLQQEGAFEAWRKAVELVGDKSRG